MRFKKIHCLTREFHVKFHLKNRYRTHRFAIRAISVFRVKFNVEFSRQAVNFSIEYEEVRELIPRIGPITIVIPFKL